jgi:hypothetical protein
MANMRIGDHVANGTYGKIKRFRTAREVRIEDMMDDEVSEGL